jgi:flagellar basal body rod protein FlgC
VYFYYWNQNGDWPANPGSPAECNDDFVQKPNVEPIAGVFDVSASLLEEEVNTNATSTPKRMTRKINEA